MKKILISSFLASFVLLVVLAPVSYGAVPKLSAAEMQQKLKDINSVKPIDFSLAKKVIVAKKGIKRPVLDLNKTPVDLSKTVINLGKTSPPPKKTGKVPNIVVVMDFPKSQEIATKFDEMSSYLALASDYWYKSFSTTQYWGSMTNYDADKDGIPELGLRLPAFVIQLCNFAIPNVDPKVSSQGEHYWNFQNTIQDVMIAEANARGVDRLLKDFDSLPSPSAGDPKREDYVSYIYYNLDTIIFLHGRCNWLFDIAPTLPPFDYTAWVFIPGMDPGADMKSCSDAYKIHAAFFRDYYKNHNLPH